MSAEEPESPIVFHSNSGLTPTFRHDSDTEILILGQGLAGCAMAWQLHWAGFCLRIMDRADGRSASRVAAGLITPVTGRRMTVAPEFEQLLTRAVAFYRRVESGTGAVLLEQQPSIRLFANDDEQRVFLTERCKELRSQVVLLHDEHGEVTGFEMPQAARLRVAEFLDVTREYFRDRSEFLEADVNVATDIVLSANGVAIPSLGLTASRLIFCQGFQAAPNPWFPGIPDGPTKGELLRVRLPQHTEQRVVHRGIWIVPDRATGAAPRAGSISARSVQADVAAADTFLVGATYDRDDLTLEPTIAGRNQLLAELAAITPDVPEILEHHVGIRAGTRTRTPVVAVHPHHPQLAILNGLGSRGSLLAPTLAAELVAGWENSHRRACALPLQGAQTTECCTVPSPLASGQTSPGKAPKRKSLTELAHSIVRRVLRAGDTAIDATAGNGHDTLFLARCVGVAGHVIAIDIQSTAIAATRNRLDLASVSNVQLVHGNHAYELSRLTDAGISARAIMFNLGYLPGGDKSTTTKPKSTVEAITTALQMLEPGGVMTTLCYRGHEGGLEEFAEVEQHLSTDLSQVLRVERIESDNWNPIAPLLFVVRA